MESEAFIAFKSQIQASEEMFMKYIKVPKRCHKSWLSVSVMRYNLQTVNVAFSQIQRLKWEEDTTKWLFSEVHF